jgi:hypothetical protein
LFLGFRTRLLTADLFFLADRTDADVSLGYSFVSSGLTVNSSTGSEGIRSAGRASLNGWDASVSLRLSHWLRMAADVSAGYGSVPVDFFTLLGSGKGNGNTNLHTYLFGPRASVSVGRLAPFGQALFGVAHKAFPPVHPLATLLNSRMPLPLISEEVSTSAWSAEWLGVSRRTTCKPASSIPPNTIRA